MKLRLLKLREVHKPANGVASFCSILWDQKGQYLVTASSSEPSISVHDALLTSSAPKNLHHHREGVTALSLSPNSTCLASGSIDHSVKLYKFPSGEFQTNITRFTLPIRTLAFNKSGSLLAAAGDDEGIKLINTIDGSIARVLKGHKGSITGLDFDPNGEYLASVDSTGTVIYWELQSGRIIHTLKGIAPDTGSEPSVKNVLSWSPDGETLAVPGLRNDVVMYDRDTAEELFSLGGDHVQPICFLSWSPNGKYIATSGLDRQVLIWDIGQRQDIGRHVFDDRICSMAWKPIGNALAVIDIKGKYGIWESVVPSSMTSPAEGKPDSRSKNSNGLLLFDEEDEELSVSGNSSDLGENSLEESEKPCRKRLRKKAVFDDELDEDIHEELSILPIYDSRKKANRGHRDPGCRNDRLMSTLDSTKPKMQEAFQPGATSLRPGQRHFLCYNMLGCITTIEHDGYSHIEIDFHDTGIGPRVPSMTDYFGFTMASLNENGSVFANPCKGEKNMSTLMYRPFSSWAGNSEWSMRFEGEEVKVVALGADWVAAVTSLNFVRIFSSGGLQKHVLSLDGPVVTASGFKDELAVVTHVADCLPSNEQMLELKVFNIINMTQPIRCRLPLTPGSHLAWFGFSEEGQLSSYDSKGVLRVFTSQYGGIWIPLFSAMKEKKTDENYWIVGLTKSKLFCVVCKSPHPYPQVTPKPVLTLLDLSLPLASSDLGAETLENELILKKMHLWEIQKRIDNIAAVGLDIDSLDDEAFNLEVAQDRCILKLIGSCCNSDKFARAIELVKLLSLEKSIKAAIKLVTKLKLPSLAEKFSSILEERLLKETNDTTNYLPKSKPDAPTREETPLRKAKTPTERIENAEPVITSSMPKLSAPIFIKKGKSPEGSRQEKEETKRNEKENVKGNGREMKTGEVHEDGDAKKIQPQRLFNASTKSSNGQEKPKTGEVTPPAPRPSNPFLKTTVR